jgi:hydroxymethylpyrimidine/phosphomethylpyrimidine kinase
MMTMQQTSRGRILIVAGSDSGGGAGIQADIKTVTALRGYAASAITALTAQNTHGVFGVHEVPVDFIRQQIALVLDDIGADCIKTGMLASISIIDAVADALEAHGAAVPLVVDPVMVAKGGAPLLAAQATETLRRRLIARATVVTPNIPEAEALVGAPIQTHDGMRRAAREILAMGPRAVLLKGGHLEGGPVIDLLLAEDGTEVLFANSRLETCHTHGTGCTLASAVATGIAQGMDLLDAVVRARHYVRRAIEQAPGLGGGHGPLDHGHTVGAFE